MDGSDGVAGMPASFQDPHQLEHALGSSQAQAHLLSVRPQVVAQ